MSNKNLTIEALLADSMPTINYTWSKTSPNLESLGVLSISDDDKLSLLKQCSSYTDFDINQFHESFKNHSPINQVIEFLNHHAFQFNSRRRFRESVEIQAIVDNSLKVSRRLDIVIPIFCVIGNWAKRMNPTTLTFSEICSLHSLQNIAKLCKRSVSVDLHFQIVADATFYIRPLGSDPVVSTKYLQDIIKYVDSNDLNNLHIHDMCCMANNDLASFEKHYMEMYKKLLVEPGYGLESIEHKSWISAMSATITTRDIDASYQDIVDTFQSNDFSSFFGREVLKRTEKAFIDYRSLKYAMSKIKWEDKYFPNSIRATIHQKNQAVMGLRIYPQYKKLSRLLPYHGVAVLEQDKNHVQMLIKPEITVVSQSKVKRYINNYGFSDFYLKTI